MRYVDEQRTDHWADNGLCEVWAIISRGKVFAFSCARNHCLGWEAEQERKKKPPESIASNRGTMAPITTMERREMERRSKQREGRLRRKFPEVHGKVVAFITHSVDDATLYFTVRFTDETSFCVRYACDIFAVGAELSDWQSGDFHIIRELKPIPR